MLKKKLYEILKRNDFSISHFDWTNTYLPGWFDVQVKFQVNGTSFIGRSLQDNADKALIVAFVESIERSMMYFFNIKNSNGIAGHFDKELALQGSQFELIERDVILSRFYTNSSYLKLNTERIESVLSPFKSAYDFIIKNKIEVGFYYCPSDNNYSTCLCLVDGTKASSPFGLNLTASTNDNIEDSIFKSFKECLSNIIHNQIGVEMKKMSLQEFNDHENPGPEEHHALARDLEYAKLAKKRFHYSTDLVIPESLQIKTRELDFKKHPELSFLKDIDLYFFQSSCEEAQNLFFGHPSSDNININRLKKYNAEINEWIKTPHPLG